MRLHQYSRLAASVLVGTAALLHIQAVGCGSGSEPGRVAVAGVSVGGNAGDKVPSRRKPDSRRGDSEQKAADQGATGGVVSVRGPRPVAISYESSLVNMEPELIRRTGRAADDKILISSNRHKIWIPRGNDSIAPANIEHIEMENGFDLVFTFTNSTSTPRRMGEIVIGGIRFPEMIGTRAIFNDGKLIQISHNNQNYFQGGANYPGGLYSPVAVLQSGHNTIGVSMLYDVREYRHDVFIRVESPGGIHVHGGRNWQVRYVFDRDDDDEGGRIQPGETRTYRVCVRATHENPQEWVRTLTPYRDFFRETYGPVRYERDPRPVAGMHMAFSSRASTSNPRGFLGTSDRPDIAGFEPVVDKLENLVNSGFSRTMLWAPTGVYRVNIHNNYPFDFTSGWATIPAMAQSKGILGEFGATSADLGLWWGNSSHLMPRSWDHSHSVEFDAQFPFHVNRAREELNGAASVNATTIGLDAMSGMPAWNAYDWVLQLQSEYPQMRFVFETMAPDFIHTLVPTYVYGTRIPADDPFAANNAHTLADFLNPGHETWASISGQDVKINAGLPPTAPTPRDLLYKRAAEAAEHGYVPVIFGPVPMTDGLEAQASWERTVPADLQD
jgi:hypothetical protein